MQFVLPTGAALLLSAAPAASADAPRGVQTDSGSVPRGSYTSRFQQQNRQQPSAVRPASAVAQDGIRIPLPPVQPVPDVPRTALQPAVGGSVSDTTSVHAEPLPPVDVTETANAVTPEVSAAVPVTTAPGAWEQDEYNRRLSAVLSGTEYTPSHQRLSAYWHQAARRFQGNNRHMVAGTVRGIRKHGPDVTVIQYSYEDEDVYDSRPIVAALGPVRKASATDEDPTAEASQRLTRDMSTISPTLSYALRGIDESQLPSEYFDRMDNGNYVARQPTPTVLQWAPTNLWYHPLYFEDAPLERYGHTYHPIVQPFASTGRFAAQLVGLPYQMALHPVHSKTYPLGYYRPGDYAPKLHYQIPFNTEAALIQAAAVTGFLFIFP